jgi:MscS family membrane protein
MGGPIRGAFALGAAWAGFAALGLPPAADRAIATLARLALFAVFFWVLVRGVGVAGEVVRRSTWARTSAVSRAIVPLATRVLGALVLVVAVISILSELGYPVASLLAGLGIGGIAVALAAQKTVSDLFGAFAIGFDQPLREGDTVKTPDVTGTVEVIGLRSTRVRTADRTLVAVPNGRLADMTIENLAWRDRTRLATKLQLAYGASADQVHAALRGIEGVLKGHPKLADQAPMVHLAGLNDAGLAIDVSAWFQTTDAAEFAAIRGEVLLGMLGQLDAAGTKLVAPPPPAPPAAR